VIEHEFEPVPGLPEMLPPGETLIWQGAPQWRVLARRAFHLKTVGAYFVALIMLRMGTGLLYEADIAAAVQSSVMLACLGAVATGILVFYAWLIARSTIYTLTDKRLVIRFGIALPMTINLPFSSIQSAAVKHYDDDCGDIALTLESGTRLSYIVMWPHTRPWNFRHPQPMLRCVAQSGYVSDLLANAASKAVAQIRRATADTTGQDLSARHHGTAGSTWGETT
jgi:hypothetical protein